MMNKAARLRIYVLSVGVGVGLGLSVLAFAEPPEPLRSDGDEPRNALAQPFVCVGNWPALQVRLVVAVIKRDEPDTIKPNERIQRGWLELEPCEQIRGKLPDRFKVAYAYRPNPLQAWSDYAPIWPDQKLRSGQRLLVAILPDAMNTIAECYPPEDRLPADDDGIVASTRPTAYRFQRYPDRVRQIGAVVRIFAIDPDDAILGDIRRMAHLWDKAGSAGEAEWLKTFSTSGGAVGEYARSRLTILRGN